MIRFIGNLLVIAAAIPATLSVICYASRPWFKSEMGRHLMSYMAVIAAVLLLSCVRLVDARAWTAAPSGTWFDWLRLVVFAGVPVVTWWRFILICKTREHYEPVVASGIRSGVADPERR